MENWEEQLKQTFSSNGDNFDNMVCTLTKEELGIEFDGGYGCTEGEPFTAWGERYVYFPVCYDGSEWVGSAPRDPCQEKSDHQGGG